MSWCVSCAAVTQSGWIALIAMAVAIVSLVAMARVAPRLLPPWMVAGSASATLALGAGFASGMIEAPGVAVLLVFGALCYLYRQAVRPKVAVALAVPIGMLAVLLATHKMPGFHGLPLIGPTTLCDGCQKWWVIGHLDKPAVGLLLFVVALVNLTLPSSPSSGGTTPHRLARSAVVTVAAVTVMGVVVMGLMSLFSAVRWAPKAPDIDVVMTFAAVNIFFTVFAEEVFFRMFLHDVLRRFPETFTRTWQLVAVSAALFALAHVAGGPLYVVGALLAGIGYGWVYEKTRRIEWAIVAHFGVNAIHFFLFSYPRLSL